MCDTYNDIRDHKCIVCGQARSEKVIKLVRARARKNLFDKIDAFLNKRAYAVIIVMAFIGMLIPLVYDTIVKATGGSVVDNEAFIRNYEQFFEIIQAKYSELCTSETICAIVEKISSSLSELQANLNVVLITWVDTLNKYI